MVYLEPHYTFTKSITFKIIALNFIIWILQLITYPLINMIFSLKPSLALSGHVYQFVTYMFLHATYVKTYQGVMIYPTHIAINMFVLAIFGFPLEQAIGKRKFTTVYMVSGIGSALFYIFMMMLFAGASDVSLLGASGAVFGVLAAYAFLFPRTWVYMFGLFPMPAAAMIVFLLLEEMFFGFMGLDPGVANFGHVGGIITGLMVMVFWKIRERESNKWEEFEFIWE